MERASLIGGVMMRKVPTDNTYAVGGGMLKKMLEEDRAAGLIPFYVRKDKKNNSIHPVHYHKAAEHITKIYCVYNNIYG